MPPPSVSSNNKKENFSYNFYSDVTSAFLKMTFFSPTARKWLSAEDKDARCRVFTLDSRIQFPLILILILSRCIQCVFLLVCWIHIIHLDGGQVISLGFFQPEAWKLFQVKYFIIKQNFDYKHILMCLLFWISSEAVQHHWSPSQADPPVVRLHAEDVVQPVNRQADPPRQLQLVLQETPHLLRVDHVTEHPDLRPLPLDVGVTRR